MPERLQHFSGYAHAHFARLLAAAYAATAAALVGPSNFRHSLSYSSRSPYSRRERY